MKIHVFDSDGIYRGGLFKTHMYNALKFRIWPGPPSPNYQERLIDISGIGKRSSNGSWYLLRLSRHPEMSGPEDSDDAFDAQSQAIKISAAEAEEWFKRCGFAVPPDLRDLLSRKSPRAKAAAVQSSPDKPEVDPHAPYKPVEWFKKVYGIPAERLRSARRNGHIRTQKHRGKFRYSVPGAKDEWPDDKIEIPAD